MRPSSSPSVRFAVFPLAALFAGVAAGSQVESRVPGGALQIIGEDGAVAGACPLKHTDVRADIAGFVGRTTVRQIFHNPTDRKIEAVYVFPLPQLAAVDSMVMTVGERRVVGRIKPRDEAREIYEAARQAGHVAGLLDQERPNIFTQSVASIEPGVEVVIEISYVETLRYEDGRYEWVFPMVVGPRYIPGGGSAPAAMTKGQDTQQVPDASKITPPVTPEGTRSGHDISLQLTIRGGSGGLPHDIKSELHEIGVAVGRWDGVAVALMNRDEIPNRDFDLSYRLGNEDIGDSALVHRDERGEFMTLILQPPGRVVPEQLVNRELVFVLDTSGSMSGFPIEKAKETMSKLIDTMHEGDAFNLITFAGQTRILWDHPRPNTPENRAEAQALLAQQKGGGGTEMMKAIEAALKPTQPLKGAHPDGAAPPPIRVVCFMTDGYVGNDMAIIDAVKKYADTARVFSFGIGNSVNRFLLDGIAHSGRGEAEYVTLESQAEAAVERFHERILAPVLTDITIDWGDLPVTDVYPRRIPDLFAAQPIMVHGRIDRGHRSADGDSAAANVPAEISGTITLRGNTGAGPFERAIEIRAERFSPQDAFAAGNPALPSLWARAKVADLMNQDLAALQQGTFREPLKSQITNLGVEFNLMTQFTSFVAVEEMTVTVGGEPVRIDVPVEMPSGVSHEGVFGEGRMGRAGGITAGAPIIMSEGGGKAPARKSAALARRAVDQRAPAVGGRAWADDEADRVLAPADKLAEPLRDLAEKVAKDGRDGNLAVGRMKVVNHRVDIIVTLSDAGQATLKALEALGFRRTGESKAARLLIGTIDVRKLAELSKLDAVTSIRPVVAP